MEHLLGNQCRLDDITGKAPGLCPNASNQSKIDSTAAKLGPVEIQVREKERVNVPLWAGIAIAAVGAVLLIKRP